MPGPILAGHQGILGLQQHVGVDGPLGQKAPRLHFSQGKSSSDLAQFIQFSSQWSEGPVQQWADVTVNLINDYIDCLSQEGYASSTVIRKVATIKSILNYLHAPGGGRSSLVKKLAKLSLAKQQRLRHLLNSFQWFEGAKKNTTCDAIR